MSDVHTKYVYSYICTYIMSNVHTNTIFYFNTLISICT